MALVLLMLAMCDFAVASAGPSNGAMFPTPSYAQPIVSVACGAADPPLTTATARIATVIDGERRLPYLRHLCPPVGSWVMPTTMLPFL